MANILKVTVATTAEVSSDILNKEAGALVKDAIERLVPVVVDAIRGETKTSEKK